MNYTGSPLAFDGADALADDARTLVPRAPDISLSAAAIQVTVSPARAATSFYPWAKRAFDLAIALLLVVLLLPLLLAVVVLVRATSEGPAIFRQERIAKDGRPFILYKFRSMTVDADPRIHQAAIERYIRGDELAADDHTFRFKLASDPRVTRVGAVLRKTSIDELPQLFNVIRGDMSLVGPRPALSYEIARYSQEALVRLSVPQGITGLWQVRGRSRVTWDEAIALDIAYVARRSFIMDCKILFLTIPAVIFGRGGR